MILGALKFALRNGLSLSALYYTLVFPFIETLKVMRQEDTGRSLDSTRADSIQWLSYWLCTVALTFAEGLLFGPYFLILARNNIFVRFIGTIYGSLRFLINFWLASPQFKGATWVYSNFLADLGKDLERGSLFAQDKVFTPILSALTPKKAAAPAQEKAKEFHGPSPSLRLTEDLPVAEGPASTPEKAQKVKEEGEEAAAEGEGQARAEEEIDKLVENLTHTIAGGESPVPAVSPAQADAQLSPSFASCSPVNFSPLSGKGDSARKGVDREREGGVLPTPERKAHVAPLSSGEAAWD